VLVYPNRLTSAYLNDARRGRATPGRLEFRSQGDSAEILIYDEISFFGISAERFATELAELRATDITVRINSPGGDVFDGMAIYRQLLDHPADIHVRVDGVAASIASVIMLAGDDVELAQHAMVMIHDPYALVVGNADDMEHMARTLDKMGGVLAGIYAARAGGTAGDWRAAMRAETWYTADEALEAGLATAIGSDAADTKAAARFDWSMFRHTPAALAERDVEIDTPAEGVETGQGATMADWRNGARHDMAEAALKGELV
jgi:ATP-dependent protease ClpP protease subunit